MASVGLSSILPAGVSETPDASAFTIALPDLVMSRSLAEMCGACAALAGATVAKPAFVVTMDGTMALPADVTGILIAGGEAVITVENGLGFDPIRPGATARGTLRLAVLSGETTVAETIVSGNDVALPSGGSVTRRLPLAGFRIDGPVRIRVAVDSPQGDPVTIDPSARLIVRASASEIRLGQASVIVPSQDVSSEVIRLELDGVDEAVLDRIEGGAIRLELTVPFAVQGTGQLTFVTPSIVIDRAVTIVPGVTTLRVELSAAEIRSLFEQGPGSFVFRGTISSAGGPVTVSPGQFVGAEAQVEAIVRASEG